MVHPIKSNHNLRVFWKLVNPQDCVWENHWQLIMRTILQEKGDNSLQHYNLVHKFIPMPQAMKIPAAKAAVDKEWEKLEKNPAWDTTRVRSKSEVIDEARTKGIKVHFGSLMDMCHLKNAEFGAKHQKYKGRVVLRGDIVKDDSGSYAVFTEQGSSASQMTAAKVMDIISTLPRCAGQAADAVSAYTQVKMEDAHKNIENSQIGVSRHLDSSTTTQNGLNHGPVWKTQSFLLSEICTVILWQDCYGQGNLRKSYWNTVGRRVPTGECLFVHRQKRVILICVCGWHKIGWKEKNIDPMWKLLNKEVDLGEPTSFLDHEYLGMHSKTMWNKQRYCWQLQNHVRIANFRGENRETSIPSNLRISSWSYDMQGHAKKCVKRFCELANKTTQQLYKVSTPCIDDHHFKEEELKSVGELSKVCSQIVLKCLNLARIGRPDFLWTVNKLARSITKWTKACDKRLNRLISYIHHTCDYKQHCHVGENAKQCRLGLFQDSDFAGDLEDSKSISDGTLCILGRHTFVPISWLCKKQTSVSHSSTESEIISLILRIRSSRKPLGMQEENWKHQWLLLCLARQARQVSMERPVARLMISSPNLRVSWKPVNPQGCVWKNLYRNIMRTMLQEKVTIHCNITSWYTNLFLCLKQWRFRMQKVVVDRGMERARDKSSMATGESHE